MQQNYRVDRFKKETALLLQKLGVTYDDSNLTVGGSGFLEEIKKLF